MYVYMYIYIGVLLMEVILNFAFTPIFRISFVRLRLTAIAIAGLKNHASYKITSNTYLLLNRL